jgi:hypothetical protein
MRTAAKALFHRLKAESPPACTYPSAFAINYNDRLPAAENL